MDDDVPRLLCGTPELPPNCVALTFDDGPGPRSAELARLLRDEGVPGTFFVLGESVERHGHVLDTYRDCGHVIGLHGDRHRPFSSAEHAAGELSRCAERVSDYLGGTAWFRPPYGMGDWPVPGFAGPVGWHAQGRDWDITYRHGQTVDACVDAIAQRAHPARRRHRAPARLRGGHRVRPGRPDRGRPGPADHRDHHIADRAAARRGTHRSSGCPSPRRPARLSRPARRAGPAGGPRCGPRRAVPRRAGPLSRRASPRRCRLAQWAGCPRRPKTFSRCRLHRATARAAGGILDVLMPIRVGDGPALFCAHPVVGLSWCYLALVPHVDARFPLYGLQARGLRRPEPLPASMEEMARDYTDQIRMAQPSGPYHLLGWSLGGNIAFAIAEELERRGRGRSGCSSSWTPIWPTARPWR